MSFDSKGLDDKEVQEITQRVGSVTAGSDEARKLQEAVISTARSGSTLGQVQQVASAQHGDTPVNPTRLADQMSNEQPVFDAVTAAVAAIRSGRAAKEKEAEGSEKQGLDDFSPPPIVVEVASLNNKKDQSYDYSFFDRMREKK